MCENRKTKIIVNFNQEISRSLEKAEYISNNKEIVNMFLHRLGPIGIRVPLRSPLLRALSTTRSLLNQQLEKPKTPPTLENIDIESEKYKNHPIIKRLPNSMKKYGKRFVNAPVSHLTAFVILHELTALAPFLGLWYAFHQIGFLPTDIPSWILVKGSSVIEHIVSASWLIFVYFQILTFDCSAW